MVQCLDICPGVVMNTLWGIPELQPYGGDSWMGGEKVDEGKFK